MCTRYSLTKGQAAILALIRAMKDSAGNVPSMPAIYPDSVAPVVRSTEKGSRLINMRWGFPKPAIYPKSGPVVNVRNVKSKYWKPWLKPEQRCLVQRRGEKKRTPPGSPMASALDQQISYSCPPSSQAAAFTSRYCKYWDLPKSGRSPPSPRGRRSQAESPPSEVLRTSV